MFWQSVGRRTWSVLLFDVNYCSSSGVAWERGSGERQKGISDCQRTAEVWNPNLASPKTSLSRACTDQWGPVSITSCEYSGACLWNQRPFHASFLGLFSGGLWTKDIWCLRLYVYWCDHPDGGRAHNTPNAGARISLIPSEGSGLFLHWEC